MTEGKALVARVAFNAHVRSLFDYKLPPDAPTDIIGRRVQAGFGKQVSVGVVMETATTTDIAPHKLKTLLSVYDDIPPLPPVTLALSRFCAEYYHCPIGIAIASMLPAFFRRKTDYKPPTGYSLINENAPVTGQLAPRLLALLRENGAMSLAMIREHIPAPHAVLKRLLDGGVIKRCHLWDTPLPQIPPTTPPQLTTTQQAALEQLRLQEGFVSHLLFGITGSGKTEVYLQAVGQALAAGKQVLVLTPEIHLTPQLENDFRRRFPNRRLCVLHSGLADGERAHRWLMAHLGVADIVLGTRLSVFTPLPRLGLLIVDEEHDDSYKQEDGMLFSARNVAIWRAKNEAVPFLAGSATPSLESYENARRGKAALLTLPKRVIAHPLTIETTAVEEGDNLYNGMNQTFIRALGTCLKNGQQALVFVNRRGYAPSLICRQCEKPIHCRRCSTTMTVHRRRHVLCCHLCGEMDKIPATCGDCGGVLMPLGIGTQRIEEALSRLFPDVAQLRLDSDSMTAGKFDKIRNDVVDGKWQLLVGTQLIAKGHNFPNLAFIGVLNADLGLAAADFRAEERLFALLSQVIGRGTRNAAGCRVLLQTKFPQHPFFAELVADDVEQCWQRLLAVRKQALMPPFSYLALLRAKHKRALRVDAFMDEVLTVARQCCPKGVHVFDSVPPLVEKVSDWHRRQVLVLSANRPLLHRFLADWSAHIPTSVPWRIDVDPINI